MRDVLCVIKSPAMPSYYPDLLQRDWFDKSLVDYNERCFYYFSYGGDWTYFIFDLNMN